MASMSQAQALRAIGQELESRDIKTFDIKCEGNLYVVQGGYQDLPAPMPVTLSYSLDDLENLNQEGQDRRNDDSGTMDFLRLSLILRAIGTHVGRKRARLLRISKSASPGTAPVFRIEYETAAGDLVINDLTSAAVYDICVQMYKLRGQSSVRSTKYTPWRR